jgi:hypothetical protein
MSDLSTCDSQSTDTIDLISPMKLNNKKMSDIIDLLDPTEFNDKQTNDELVGDYLRAHNLQNDQDSFEKSQWETEENYLKYGKIIVVIF